MVLSCDFTCWNLREFRLLRTKKEPGKAKALSGSFHSLCGEFERFI